MKAAAITPAHCRAARGLLDWTLKHLSTRSGLNTTVLRDFERDRPSLSAAALRTLRATFEDAGLLIHDAEQPGTLAGLGVTWADRKPPPLP